MTSASVAPPFRSSRATTVAVLLPSRTPSAFGFVAFLGSLVAFLAGVVFLADLALDGATGRACFAALAFVGAFGSGVSPRVWIRPQIRLAAALALLNTFTGSTPGRLFQISTRP